MPPQQALQVVATKYLNTQSHLNLGTQRWPVACDGHKGTVDDAKVPCKPTDMVVDAFDWHAVHGDAVMPWQKAQAERDGFP